MKTESTTENPTYPSDTLTLEERLYLTVCRLKVVDGLARLAEFDDDSEALLSSREHLQAAIAALERLDLPFDISRWRPAANETNVGGGA